MTKELSDYFFDWYNDTFGYGYGTGDEFYCRDLMGFFFALNHKGPELLTYDYKTLEDRLGKPSAWHIINILCKEDFIDYGTSPRNGWLTKKGLLLNKAIGAFNHDSLYEFVTGDVYDVCYPTACNHTDLHEKGCLTNPFWHEKEVVKWL